MDIVVTDKSGNPVTGLTKDDFEVFEGTGIGKGERQAVASFEEHKGAPPSLAPSVPLPPHFFTNSPSVPSAGSINVLLLDALNTHFEDQGTVRRQMISYLKIIDPGPRLAIFTLGSRLRIVEGFSSDPRALLDALNHHNWGGKPQASTLLPTDSEARAQQTMLQEIFDANPDSQSAMAAVEALQWFLNEEKVNVETSRTSRTLEALRQLSEYLSGFSGRKNLIWFAGSFPTNIFSYKKELAEDSGLGSELKQTINQLAAAQVAVYPVAAQGLETEPLFQASQSVPMSLAPTTAGPGGKATTVPMAERVTEGTNQRLADDSLSQYRSTEAQDEIASETGGQAFYNSNGLKDALTEAIHKGSYYYSLSYPPADKTSLGRYRHIEIKLREKHYTLAYRRGYFEGDEKQRKDENFSATRDPLQPLMVRGLPDSTQLTFKLRVVPLMPQASPNASTARDNGQLQAPVKRFSADFVIPIENLDFTVTDDGVRHADIELALVGYDHDGKPLNWLYRSIKASLKPDIYPAVQKTGAQFHQEIDIPDGENYLRAGVYDRHADNSGTLEIPLNRITSSQNAATTQSTDTHNGSAPSPSEPPAKIAFSPDLLNTLTASTGNTLGRVVATENASGTSLSLASGPISSSEEKNGSEPADIDGYCAVLAGTSRQAAALAKICEFALSIRKNLPDVMCERETKRYWKTLGDTTLPDQVPKPDFDYDNHADVITAKVTYREGQEYYDNVRVDGRPADASAPWSSGAWSVGEFAVSLNTIFFPSSKPEFQYVKQEKLHSIRATVFDFHVSAQNNKSYFLTSGGKAWFPEYHGRIWLEEGNSRLLRLERETAEMPGEPIRRMKTLTDYSMINLPDATEMVLPIHSDVLICSGSAFNAIENCARNIVTFSKWQKFRATTKIVSDPN